MGWEAAVVIVLLIGVVWIKQTMISKDSYRKGASDGFVLGIDRTIKVMLEQHMLARKDDEPFPTKEELLIKLAPMITSSVTKELEQMVAKNTNK